MFCERCGHELGRNDRFCESCGTEIPTQETQGVWTTATEAVCNAAGVEKISGFSITALFSEAFRKHSRAEIEKHLYVGTLKTTPSIGRVTAEWPKPWMFVRCLLVSVFAYVMFAIGLRVFEGACCIPGLLIMGTLVIPLSISVFFFELNVWKNIAIHEFGRAILIGGVVAIIITFILNALFTAEIQTISVAGLVEEPAKLAALVYVTRGKRWGHKLNGLVLGAAIGTGFSIFESMGYAFSAMLSTDTLEEGIAAMQFSVFVRGILSAFCDHVVWTAIAGAALWRVMKPGVFEVSDLFRLKFLRLFAVPVACHVMYNWTAEQSELLWFALVPVIGIVSWLIVLSLANEGIKEVNEMKATLQPKLCSSVGVN